MIIHMKAVQITLDEGLLQRLDALPEVREKGRSAFLRQVVRAYLQHRRQQEIREAYKRGYGDKPVQAEEFTTDPERLGWLED